MQRQVAAFDRFTDFVDVPAQNGQAFDVVIFDTAPTGHTLRLLELPAEWSRSIEAAAHGSGQTCIGPAAAIQDARAKYERTLTTMRDSAHTTFTFVLQPEAIAIKETKRATAELGKLGIRTHQLIVNGIIPPEETANPLFAARAEMQAGYLQQIENELPLPARHMFLLPGEIKGIVCLREVAQMLFDGARTQAIPTPDLVPAVPVPARDGRRAVLPRILPNGRSHSVFFAGKGGVGKTLRFSLHCNRYG